MNIPPDVIAFLQQLFFRQNSQADALDHGRWAVGQFLRLLAGGLTIPVLVSLTLILTAFLVYRPRLTRGALWVPLFGLFGGTPTLYLHTRPASVCGLFSHSRRFRHARRKRAA